MAIGTYAELQAAISAWLDRSDYAALVPTFIRLAEAEFSRVLRTPDMEARAEAELPAGANRLSVPVDMRQLRMVRLPNGSVLESLALGPLLDAYRGRPASTPAAVAHADGQLWFGPGAAHVQALEIVYWRSVPALSTANATNWLLQRHPDLYLMASVAQAELYGWNDDRLPILKRRTDEILEQINREARAASRGPRVRMRAEVVV